MLRSTWLLFVYLSFLGIGFAAPFVAVLGYVWVDAFRPQQVAYVFLNQVPVAAVMGGAAFAAYVALDRRHPPPLMTTHLLVVVMAAWITATLLWAVSPGAAWHKWDWAFKVVLFSAFVPLVIRSRVQIEAFVQVWVFSIAANFMTFGAKTLLSGGGYGTNLGLQQGNSGLSEGGLLSTVCLMVVPLALFLSQHSTIVPRNRIVSLGYMAMASFAALTAIGTYQRSALIGLLVLGVFLFIKTRHKFAFGCVGFMALLGLIYLTSDEWGQRISTIKEYSQESSALVRILVWKWTLGFVATHPLGGGFQSFLINHIELPPSPGNPGGISQFGRAFHSVYFEVLGEHGWPGLCMFLFIAMSTFIALGRIRKRTKLHPELRWCSDLAEALQAGLVVFLACGAFVGIAFQPMFWYTVAMSLSLRAYVWRVTQLQTEPIRGWRANAAGTETPTVSAVAASPYDADWRTRVNSNPPEKPRPQI